MCGIIGLVKAEKVNVDVELHILAADGLVALQHRGTESAGLVGSDGTDRQQLEIIKGHGLVRDVLMEENLSKLNGSKVVIGHNRYSTAGKKRCAINCVQPFVVYTAIGAIAIAHNGELTDARKKREEILHEGVGLSTDTDSELIAQMELAVTMSSISMSYSLLVMSYDRVYAIRDPYGNRPLCVGTIYNTNKSSGSPIAYCAASESCALPSTAELNFEVRSGEIVEITSKGIRSVCQFIDYTTLGLRSRAFYIQMKPQIPQAMCIFEYVYFARNDSIIEGQQIQTVREECGKILALESHVGADVVSNVPDSSTAAAIGYAAQSGVPYEPCLHRNSYVGRSFIQPCNAMRQSAIHKKFGHFYTSYETVINVKGRRIVLIDDSIVRGNTMRILVQILRNAGAKEVHLRIASPPVVFPCFMGINIPTTEELLASKRNIDEITKYIGATSVMYLSLEGLHKAVQSGIRRSVNFTTGHCSACLDGKYPTSIDF
ncbi:amidophosphoribosyltransferase [Dictyocaulus viviparus]|uniref:Amidophosphoribosyltransferase n=1 Tax=Dictyocaulus viviparus TaxID=29172 RepID=A0A0D8Y8A9_DICVI|nr:amidophosphoribosyltransferase [Dictyocaulus viviparus]